MRPDLDYYAVLGVSRDATAPEIRRAYRRLARRHHPDLNSDPENPGRFVALAHAYEVLNDPARRADYDHTLDVGHASRGRTPPRPPRTPMLRARPRMRGIIELTAGEARHLARWPLALYDPHGGVIVLPAGINHGDQITVSHGGRLVLLGVRVQGKT